jgi:hypothetical protein
VWIGDSLTEERATASGATMVTLTGLSLLVNNPFFMGNFVDHYEDQSDIPDVRRSSREVAVEVLKLLTASLAFAASIAGLATKYPWLLKPWVLDGVIVLGILTVAWLAKPRVAQWVQRIRQRRREQRFVATNVVRLREFVDQFAEFLSDNNTKSLRYIVRSACSQNMTEVEKILSGDYLGNWLFCFREQLMFREKSLPQFLSRCREFTSIVQQFNSNYAQRAQRVFTSSASIPPEHVLDELEGFRKDSMRFCEIWSLGQKELLASFSQLELLIRQPNGGLRLSPTSISRSPSRSPSLLQSSGERMFTFF